MKRLGFLLFILLFAGPLSAQNFDNGDSEDVLDYESIVKELSTKSRTTYKNYGYDPLATVKFHMGVGFSNSLVSLENLPGDTSIEASLKGVQAKFGVDLLSPSWRAEGGILTYETYKDEANNQYSLKEFDLSIINLGPLGRFWGYKFGGGLSARYLQFKLPGSPKVKYTTPAANLQMGVTARFSSKLSISTDISYRKALVTDTADRAAFDFSLRFDGHF